MEKFKLEIKWAFIFIAMSLLWMVLEKAVGLHSTHIDKHMYVTNLFAIPAILIYVLALREKKTKDYNGVMSFKQGFVSRSEEHTSELQSRPHLVCRLLLEKKN